MKDSEAPLLATLPGKAEAGIPRRDPNPRDAFFFAAPREQSNRGDSPSGAVPTPRLASKPPRDTYYTPAPRWLAVLLVIATFCVLGLAARGVHVMSATTPEIQLGSWALLGGASVLVLWLLREVLR